MENLFVLSDWFYQRRPLDTAMATGFNFRTIIDLSEHLLDSAMTTEFNFRTIIDSTFVQLSI